MSLLIRNARVLDPASGMDEVSDVLLDQGLVQAVGQDAAAASTQDSAAAEVIDATGQWLMPGAVDLGCWLRAPGLDHKATIESEAKAAAASGVTTLCYQPEPAAHVESAAQYSLIKALSWNAHYVRVEVIGNLTKKLRGEQLANMRGLKNAGCVAVSNGWQPYESLNTLRKSLEYATTHELTVFLFPLEHALANDGCVHEGEVSTRLGLPGIPAAAETVAVAQALALIELTGTKVHFCRLSAAGSVRLIRQAKADGLNVSADVAAHQLFLTENDMLDYNPLCYVMPPLRAEADREALLEGIQDGTIDAICSDHQPHEADAKMAPLQQTEPGISGLESLLPLTLRLVEDGSLSLMQALGKITYQPANIIANKVGRIAPQTPADLVLFDPDMLREFSVDNMHSSGKNSPFNGWSFQGSVTATLLAGERVYTAG